MTNHVHAGTKAAALLVIALGGCSFKEPDAKDPSQILGCYLSEGAPEIIVRPDRLEVKGVSGAISYRYEHRKIGPVMRAPITAHMAGGQPAFERSDDHFYRVLFSEGTPFLRVAFGREGAIYDYRRVTEGECRS